MKSERDGRRCDDRAKRQGREVIKEQEKDEVMLTKGEREGRRKYGSDLSEHGWGRGSRGIKQTRRRESFVRKRFE